MEYFFLRYGFYSKNVYLNVFAETFVDKTKVLILSNIFFRCVKLFFKIIDKWILQFLSNIFICQYVILNEKKNYLITAIGKRMARSCVPYFIAEVEYLSGIKRNLYLPWNYNVKSSDIENEILYLSGENLDTYLARRS